MPNKPDRSDWPIPADCVYLNHGSFGPTPRPVLEARRQWSEQLAANPMDFYTRKLAGHLEHARSRLGEFIGADCDDLVFVENATTGMNVVAESVRLAQGDEVLLNDHEYGAVARIWRRACCRQGAGVVTQTLPWPMTSADEVVERLMAGVTPRTRLIVVSHVTSPTAVILPIERICRAARERGVVVCVDGPHALAMLDVDIRRLDCDYYTASCHKWLSAPLGSGFLFVNRRVQATVQPAVVSWGRVEGEPNASWRDEFQWVGTRDPAAFLAVPAAIDFLIERGLDNFRCHGHDLARYARERITALTGLPPPLPDRDAWYGTMATLPLPPCDGPSLQAALWANHRIEVPVMVWAGERFIRISCHMYNTRSDVDRLESGLAEELKAEDRSKND